MNDPGLARIASGLQYLVFDIDATEREDFRKRAMFNLSLFPNSRTWRVRTFLLGRIRVIGTTGDGPSAARFADASRIFFWPYRVRNAHPPTEAEMNVSLEQAESDLEHVAGLREIFQSVVQHLQLDLPTPGKPKREDRRTVRSDVNLRFAELEKQLLALATLNEKVLEQLRLAEKQHVELRDAFRRIEKLLPRERRAFYTDTDGVEHEMNDDGTPYLDSTPVVDEIEQENERSKQPL